MTVKIKLTKRNRDKYLEEFIKLEDEYLLKLKDFLRNEKLPDDFEDYTIDNFFFIREIYKKTLKKPGIQVKKIENLPDIETTNLPICFAYHDWVGFRCRINEKNLVIGLAFSFYLKKIINKYNKSYLWNLDIDDTTYNYLGKNHPKLEGNNISCNPLWMVMFYSSQIINKDEYWLKNEYSLLKEDISKMVG